MVLQKVGETTTTIKENGTVVNTFTQSNDSEYDITITRELSNKFTTTVNDIRDDRNLGTRIDIPKSGAYNLKIDITNNYSQSAFTGVHLHDITLAMEDLASGSTISYGPEDFDFESDVNDTSWRLYFENEYDDATAEVEYYEDMNQTISVTKL